MNPSNLIAHGELEIVKLTEDLYDQAVEIFLKYFMRYENLSIAMNLLGSQQTIDEMEIFIRAVLKDGVSFGAKVRGKNELVGICANTILNPSANLTVNNVFDKFTSRKMEVIGDFLDRLENKFNIFKEWNIKCALEIMFLSTRPDYAGKGIALALSQYSIEYARKMLHGTLPEDELQTLPPQIRDQRPEAVCSVFSSLFSQKVGEKLGMQTLSKIAYSEFSFEGKTLAEKIDSIHKCSLYAAMKL